MTIELRLVILGSGGVGKSAITIQFTQNHFIEIYDPTIEDCYRKQIIFDGNSYLLDILDTAGQDEYSAMRDQYYHAGEGFVLVYSIADLETFLEIESFVEKIYMCKDNKNIPFVLCGNKSDIGYQRQVNTIEGLTLAKKLKCPFIECSAKTRYNIDEVWYGIIKEVVKKRNIKPNIKKKTENCLIL
jgi:GTPase KRas protein